jgi:hypothetical protein
MIDVRQVFVKRIPLRRATAAHRSIPLGRFAIALALSFPPRPIRSPGRQLCWLAFAQAKRAPSDWRNRGTLRAPYRDSVFPQMEVRAVGGRTCPALVTGASGMRPRPGFARTRVGEEGSWSTVVVPPRAGDPAGLTGGDAPLERRLPRSAQGRVWGTSDCAARGGPGCRTGVFMSIARASSQWYWLRWWVRTRGLAVSRSC